MSLQEFKELLEFEESKVILTHEWWQEIYDACEELGI